MLALHRKRFGSTPNVAALAHTNVVGELQTPCCFSGTLKKKKLVMFLRTLFGAAPGTSKWEPHPCVCARHLRDCCCLTFLARHRPQHLAFGQSKPSSLTVSETELLTTHLCGGRKTMHLYSYVCVRRGRRGRGVFVSVQNLVTAAGHK